MRKFLLMPMMLLMAWTAQAEVTHLQVEMLYGTEIESALNTIGKITFNVQDEEMCLSNKSGEIMGCTSLRLIDKIVFVKQETATAISDEESPTIQVFPNPTQECIFIRGIEGQQTVRIFNMLGYLMLSEQTMDGETILHVGGLQNGTYLLQIGAQVVKVIKE